MKSIDTRVDLNTLIDRQEIVDLLVKYTMAVDTKNWALLEQCFTPDAVADYGEDFGYYEGYPAIETVLKSFHLLDVSQHMLGNYVVEINGNSAKTICYVHAQHYIAGAEGGDTFTVGGTCRDEMIRTDDGWRITKRTFTMTWAEGNTGMFDNRV